MFITSTPFIFGCNSGRTFELLIPAVGDARGPAPLSSLSLSRRGVASFIWRLLKAVQIGGVRLLFQGAVTAADICMPYLATSTRSESLMGSRAELITWTCCTCYDVTRSIVTILGRRIVKLGERKGYSLKGFVGTFEGPIQ